ETRALVASAAGTFQFFAAACETLEETITPARGDYLTMSIHEPLGVIAAITSWNSPIASEAQKLAPALAAGNAVVVKPAEVTPLAALELGRICEQAGVPKGVVSVVPGKGSVIGDAIVKHPLVKKVSFTGGTTTGRALARLAADKLMPVTLELGGKSPTIVFEDADLDQAVNGGLYGIFSSSGESCIAGSRLFVQESIRAQFLDRLAAKAKTLRVGDPEDPRTQMGPLITAKHRESIERYVQLGLDEGGKLIAGGERPEGRPVRPGLFLPAADPHRPPDPRPHLPGRDLRAGLGRNAFPRRARPPCAGERQRLRARGRHLDPRLQARVADCARTRDRHRLDPYAQAVLNLDAVQRHPVQRPWHREGAARDRPVLAPEDPVLGPERGAVPVG